MSDSFKVLNEERGNGKSWGSCPSDKQHSPQPSFLDSIINIWPKSFSHPYAKPFSLFLKGSCAESYLSIIKSEIPSRSTNPLNMLEPLKCNLQMKYCPVT